MSIVVCFRQLNRHPVIYQRLVSSAEEGLVARGRRGGVAEAGGGEAATGGNVFFQGEGHGYGVQFRVSSLCTLRTCKAAVLCHCSLVKCRRHTYE